MPVKKSRKTAKKVNDFETTDSSEDCCCGQKKNILKIHLTFLLIVVVVLGVLGYFFRDKFLAAIVNGKPVLRYQLNKSLTASYGKETLENLIVEQLIKEEVKKNQIVVTIEEIDKEVEKISKNLSGGMKIEDALKAQGMTLDNLKTQLKLRLQVNKILEKDVSVTDEEIDKFLKDNGKSLTATVEAEKRTEATNILKEQKLSSKIQTWISDLLAKAKISRYLK